MTNFRHIYTRDEIVPLIKEITAEQPLRTNPTKQGACQYDDGNGNHCIAGEVMYRLGLRLPQWNGIVDDTVTDWSDNFDGAAIDVLRNAQRLADGQAAALVGGMTLDREQNVEYSDGSQGPKPRPWAVVGALFELSENKEV